MAGYKVFGGGGHDNCVVNDFCWVTLKGKQGVYHEDTGSCLKISIWGRVGDAWYKFEEARVKGHGRHALLQAGKLWRCATRIKDVRWD